MVLQYAIKRRYSMSNCKRDPAAKSQNNKQFKEIALSWEIPDVTIHY